MSNKKQGNKKNISKKVNTSSKTNKSIAVAVGVVVVLIVVIFIIKGSFSGDKTASSTGNLIIPKSEITETAKFYPYLVGGTKMEVIAVKASDGSIRTAFNTCQVCYNSGRGYYKQEGNELVCQNCGNRFKIDQVELQKNGCNPVPILTDNKTDDGTNITISQDFLTQNKGLFSNWKTR